MTTVRSKARVTATLSDVELLKEFRATRPPELDSTTTLNSDRLILLSEMYRRVSERLITHKTALTAINKLSSSEASHAKSG